MVFLQFSEVLVWKKLNQVDMYLSNYYHFTQVVLQNQNANEVTQFQVYVDNQLGVEFLTPQHTLKLFSDIKESLKEKYPIFRLESFNTPLRVMINDAKSDYSSMPDFLLYKLTSESEPDISEPQKE